MRNLNNFNHWIAELRAIALSRKTMTVNLDGSESVMGKREVNNVFSKTNCRDEFMDGQSPLEAYEGIIDQWQEAENAYCQSAQG